MGHPLGSYRSGWAPGRKRSAHGRESVLDAARRAARRADRDRRHQWGGRSRRPEAGRPDPRQLDLLEPDPLGCQPLDRRRPPMKVVTSLSELRAARRASPEPFGLVPTMGFLHEGHLSLVRRARVECAAIGVSIFVNPSQFGPSEDLEAYPRDLARDLRMLAADGVDLVWTPNVEDVYPPGFQTWGSVDGLNQRLGGEDRPGGFPGGGARPGRN